MAIIKWSDDYKIGHKQIDQEHWGLFAIIHDLDGKLSLGADETSIAITIEALVDYVAVHFEHEERLMRLSGYPGFYEHKKLHNELAEKVHQYEEVFLRAPKGFNYEEFMEFLGDWLATHIVEEDTQIANCIKNAQPSAQEK